MYRLIVNGLHCVSAAGAGRVFHQYRVVVDRCRFGGFPDRFVGARVEFLLAVGDDILQRAIVIQAAVAVVDTLMQGVHVDRAIPVQVFIPHRPAEQRAVLPNLVAVPEPADALAMKINFPV